MPDAHTPVFAEGERKQCKWNVFVEKATLHPGYRPDVIAGVAGFLMPHAIDAAKLLVGSSEPGHVFGALGGLMSRSHVVVKMIPTMSPSKSC